MDRHSFNDLSLYILSYFHWIVIVRTVTFSLDCHHMDYPVPIEVPNKRMSDFHWITVTNTVILCIKCRHKVSYSQWIAVRWTGVFLQNYRQKNFSNDIKSGVPLSDMKVQDYWQ